VTRIPKDSCFTRLGRIGQRMEYVEATGLVVEVRSGDDPDPVLLTPPPGTVCRQYEWFVYDLEGNDVTNTAGRPRGDTCYELQWVGEPGYYHAEATCREGSNDPTRIYAFGIAVMAAGR